MPLIFIFFFRLGLEFNKSLLIELGEFFMSSKLNVSSGSPDRHFTPTFLPFRTANGINFITKPQIHQVLLRI